MAFCLSSHIWESDYSVECSFKSCLVWSKRKQIQISISSSRKRSEPFLQTFFQTTRKLSDLSCGSELHIRWRCPCSLQGGWTRCTLEVLSNPNHSTIWFSKTSCGKWIQKRRLDTSSGCLKLHLPFAPQLLSKMFITQGAQCLWDLSGKMKTIF